MDPPFSNQLRMELSISLEKGEKTDKINFTQ